MSFIWTPSYLVSLLAHFFSSVIFHYLHETAYDNWYFLTSFSFVGFPYNLAIKMSDHICMSIFALNYLYFPSQLFMIRYMGNLAKPFPALAIFAFCYTCVKQRYFHDNSINQDIECAILISFWCTRLTLGRTWTCSNWRQLEICSFLHKKIVLLDPI